MFCICLSLSCGLCRRSPGHHENLGMCLSICSRVSKHFIKARSFWNIWKGNWGQVPQRWGFGYKWFIKKDFQEKLVKEWRSRTGRVEISSRSPRRVNPSIYVNLECSGSTELSNWQSSSCTYQWYRLRAAMRVRTVGHTLLGALRSYRQGDSGSLRKSPRRRVMGAQFQRQRVLKQVEGCVENK